MTNAGVRFVFSYTISILPTDISCQLHLNNHHLILYFHTTVGLPKTELGPLPLIRSSRGPLSPGTHPLQAPNSTVPGKRHLTRTPS